MVDVVHVIEAGPVHLEVVANNLRADEDAAVVACGRIKPWLDRGDVETEADVEDDRLYVDIHGNGFAIHLSLKLDPEQIRRAAGEVLSYEVDADGEHD